MVNPPKPVGLTVTCRVCGETVPKLSWRQVLCGKPICRRRSKTDWQKQWQKKHPTEHAKFTKITRQRYPDLRRARRAVEAGRTRAEKYGVLHDPYSPQDLVAMLFAGCHICGSQEGTIGWDHVIPMIRGGADSLTNIRPAHWSCNRRKGRRLIEEMR